MDRQNIFDPDLILTFLFQFNQFEKALRQAGFAKAGLPHEADWGAFISRIDERFDPKAALELEAAVDFVLVSYGESRKPFPLRDIILLADQIQRLGKCLSRNINFRAPTSEEYDTMMAAMVILVAWFELL